MSLLSRFVVFVPACLLCPILQAKFDENKTAWNTEIRSYLQQNGISVIQMPCSETSFQSPHSGMGRKPHGVSFYEKLPGYTEHSRTLAHGVADQIQDLITNGYSVVILGIEHSPSCAVSYIYMGPGRGPVHRSGIFIQALRDELNARNINVPMIGINRRFPKKAISELCNVLQTHI